MIHYDVKMPPTRSRDRLVAIVDAATEVLARDGFARAQMVEIARVAGVSVGTLYNYVEGKEALLLLCAERPFGGVFDDRPLPVAAIDRPALIRAIEAALAERVRVPTLERVLGGHEPTDDPSAELAGIVSELFDLFASTRRAADAMERCALDAPDLAEVFYRGVRGRLLAQLAAYFERRAARDTSTSVSPDAGARFVVETVTWWARHRHRDPEPLTIDDAAARGVAVELVVRALGSHPGDR
jgi:AcrR family transcriptional regulator